MRSILILFVLVLTSCTRVEPKMTVTSNKEKFVIENFAKSVTAVEFTYKGHSYIWFHNNNGEWDGNDGLVHNPDCKCNKKIKSTTQY